MSGGSAVSEQHDEQTPEEESAGYITLRSGRLLRKHTEETSPSNQTPKSKPLLFYLLEATKIEDLSLEHCLELGKQISLQREQRIEDIRKFKEETERFKRDIVEFRDLSRSQNSVIDSRSLDISNLRSEDFELSWDNSRIDDSTKTEKDLDWSKHSSKDSSNKFSPKIVSKTMSVNFEKVVKLTAQMVPLFSGEASPQLVTELQTFIGCCRQVQQCLQDEEKQAFLHILQTRLRGNAYTLISSSTFSKFEEVEQLLYQSYLPRETYQELINKLITCKQYPLESLTSFTSRIKQLLTQCKEAAEVKYGATGLKVVNQQLEDFAINSLKCGVSNPLLSTYLLPLNDTTLDGLTQKCLNMEKLLQGNPHLQQGHQHIYNLPYAITTGMQGNTYSAQCSDNFPNCPPFGSHPGQNSITPTPPNALPIPVTGHTTTQSSNPVLTPQMLQPIPQVTSFMPANAFASNTHEVTYHQNQSNVRHPPTAAALTNLYPHKSHSDRVPQNNNDRIKSTLARITCAYCKMKGHTYDDCLKRKNTPYCVRCKIGGHDAKDCRNKDNYPRENLQTNRVQDASRVNSRVYHLQLRCDFCGRRGHSISECRQKERWEARNSGNARQSTENSPARL